MKYLVVGLGNIGIEYADTRHNFGFLIVDDLAEKFKGEFKVERYGQMAKIKSRGRTMLLLKPSTYMNRSGRAIRHWVQKEKISATNLLVIVDDINLEFGRIRLRGKGRDGGHNGLRDIVETMGPGFARLRLGIGNEFRPGEQSDYVLGHWTEEEKNQLPSLISRAHKAVLSYVSIGIKRTMDQFNN